MYAEAPDDVLRALWENGVPEWWKGTPKDKLFWRHRPLSLRVMLTEMEISAMLSYIEKIEAAAAVRKAAEKKGVAAASERPPSASS